MTCRPAKPMITIVGHAGTCEIVLAELGFYVRCLNCPHVSEITHAKYRARMWAEEHNCPADLAAELNDRMTALGDAVRGLKRR